jgi:hypothetical protein
MHLKYNNVNENYSQGVCLSVLLGEGHAPLSGGDAMTSPRPRNIAASIHQRLPLTWKAPGPWQV